MRRTTSLAISFFLACGAIAGALAVGLVPAGLVDLSARELQRKPFVLTRPSDNLVEVTEAKWFLLPMLFGDFDLQMDVEVSEGVELDMLLRQVEPRLHDDQLLPFAGRFSVLRLSTDGDGVGWRTRDEALLGPKGNGVGIAPGHLATVWVEARGRELHANVAGKTQPPFVADDVYGMMTMIVKGGKAVIHRLEITPRDTLPMWPWSRWTWGSAGLLAAGLLSLLALRRPQRLVWAGVILLSYAWLIVRGIDLDLAFPAVPGMVLALSLPMAMALLVLCLPGSLWLWFMTALLVVAGSAASRHVVPWPGLLRSSVELLGGGVEALQTLVATAARTTDSQSIDAVFGPKAGAQISEAHGLLVRGPTGLVDSEHSGPCVFLLGGQLLYDQGMPGDHLALLLERQLRGELRAPVEVPCLPTVDGYAAQQWQLFERFFQAFSPEVVVLGVGPYECAVPDGQSEPRSSPALLGQTIVAARKACAASGRQLVLFAAEGVTADILLKLREQEALGVPLVVALPGHARSDVARELAAACKPFLK